MDSQSIQGRKTKMTMTGYGFLQYLSSPLDVILSMHIDLINWDRSRLKEKPRVSTWIHI